MRIARKVFLALAILLSSIYCASIRAQGLPGWSDSDVGTVGLAGSATYANGTFTVKGAGQGLNGSSDGFNFAYQSLSGDGTIVARVASLQGSGGTPFAGVMIRETLTAGSTTAYMAFSGGYLHFYYRTSTGSGTSSSSPLGVTLPYWVKVIRSGSTFSGYASMDGVNWTQVGINETITMAQNVYVGLATTNGSTSALATGTFDGVSINSTASPAPVITSVSATTGSVGSQVVINGSNFGASQNGSLVTLNNAPMTVNSWSGTSITITIASGATSGPLLVSVAPSMNDSNAVDFTVTANPLPTPWLDQDVGSVGIAGSATYANGVFTVKGAGQGLTGLQNDGFHFVYQPLSGDGTIVARVTSLQGSGGSPTAGVMIRETLATGSTFAYMEDSSAYASFYFYWRATTGGSTSGSSPLSKAPPYWIKVVRSGSTFSGFASSDGVNWVQVGINETITMAQNVYVGLVATDGSTSALATATFDGASVNSAASPAPVITSLSATTGSVGSPVLINGSGFGATQGGSLVMLNGAPVTIDSWTATGIAITIPSGATSGPLLVSIAPSMNDSNAVPFTVTTNPLPTSWIDQDVGSVGIAGSATYSNGVFTVKGAGQGLTGTNDGFHFVYQPLSGDSTIVARLTSLQGSGGSPTAGVMIRESLAPGSTFAYMDYSSGYGSFYFNWRTSTGGTSTGSNPLAKAPPYWVKAVRSGSTFSGYVSLDAVNWVQMTTQTINMAQNVYVGLVATNGNTSALATATFDEVSVSSAGNPAPVITSVSATSGSVGSQVVINGSNFGASQNGNLVTLNNVPVTLDSWSSTSIIITIPSGATSGPLLVSVAPSMNDSNAIPFTVTANPLPTPWLDQDVGSVGISGTATYASGTFTLQGAGQGVSGTSDSFHIAYLPLSGDGTIVARVASLQGGTSAFAGVMIRETLTPGSTFALTTCYTSALGICNLYYRTSTGGTSSGSSQQVAALPRWVRLARNGSSFSSYISSDGVSWSQIGTSVTINMAQNVYVGLIVSNGSSTPALATATFDNVTVTIGTTPFVTGVSPVLGGIGASVTITGSNFGLTQGNSTVTFNGAQATSITSWSSTQIVATVPNNAPSGQGLVTVTVNSIASPSNVTFTVINPIINSVTPPAAPLSGLVTLNGVGFGTVAGTVQFNSVSASILSWNDTTVKVSVPATAMSGTVTLFQDGVPSNAVSFTVLEALSITGISPSVGPVGTSVMITGAGFGPTQSNSTANFYNMLATITSWSDTQITAVVPSGTATGPVNVQVAGINFYGPSFNITSTLQVTDSLGNLTSYFSANVGGKWAPSISQGSGCSSCTIRGTISYTYDSKGNPLSRTDENGNTTTYTYDSNGNVLSVTAPINSTTSATTSYTYNSFGEVLTTTDPLGFVTTNTYDSHGNLLTVTTPSPDGGTTPGSVTTFTYNSLGELLTIKDPLNNVTTLTYYPTGLINTITDAQNNVTTYAYDSHGNRTSVTDALGNQTTFAYDAMDRLTTITYPGNTGTTTFGYDYRGRRTSVTDQNGKTTTYGYDDADRLTTVTDAANNVTTYGYDTENNLTSITDANNHTTSFTYDAFGRVTKTTFPSGNFETYSYDSVGNLMSKTDRKNQLVTYTYDQLNRLTQKLYPDNSTVNYTYDKNSRLTQVTDPTGTYQFAFDNMGRLTGTTTQYGFLTGRTFTTSYSYDAASNRTRFTDPESGATSYVYDTLNRLQTLTPPAAIGGGSFGFSYDALSRRTQMTRPNGLQSIYAYDNLSHLLSVLHQSGSTTLDGTAYTVDNAGNRTSRTPQPSGTASNYTYDNIYQLTTVTQGGPTTESYTYDAVGNRLTSLSGSFGYNTSNEMTSSPTATLAYDNNGNTLTSTTGTNTTSNSWDFENRLSSVTLPGTGGTVSFAYDPFGRRIKKVSSAGTSIYVYDGDNLIEETNSSGTAVARYSQTQNVDEPLAMLLSSTTSYYHADGLGSVTSLSNTAGALAQTYTFDSFGKLTASSGSLTNPFQYTGRESDSETGLYYYRARYYDPNTGRFVTEDPRRFNADIDFYLYTDNNPSNFIDPSGLLKVCCRPADIGKKLYNAGLVTNPNATCHCFLQMSNGDTLGGYNKPWGVLHKKKNDDDDLHPKNKPTCTDLGNGNECTVRKFFDSYPTYQPYGITGLTSNSVPAQILNNAGIGYVFPSCAWGKGTGPLI